MRVGIIGAGIGGLTLAQALIAQNIEVIVFDRDLSAEETGGYRLHLSEDALASIRKHLPENIEKLLKLSGTGPESFQQFSILNHHGKTKLSFRQTDEEDLLMIGRIPLRKILAIDLEKVIRWDTQFTHYKEEESGITLHFSNAQSEKVDILVGADGVHSAVAKQLLGRSTAKYAGVMGIAGRALLTPQLGSTINKDFFKGPGFAVGPKGIGMFITVHAPKTNNELKAGMDVLEDPYIVWSVAATDKTLRKSFRNLTSDQLEKEAYQLIRHWDESFLELINNSEKGRTAAFPFWYPSNLTRWKHSKITLIGDAIHPMPPTSGLGASTSILDAVNLAEKLVKHDDSSYALQAYQADMLKYAPKAVAEARPPLFWQRRFKNNFIRRFAMSVLLPCVSVVLKIKDSIKK